MEKPTPLQNRLLNAGVIFITENITGMATTYKTDCPHHSHLSMEFLENDYINFYFKNSDNSNDNF